MQTSSPIKLLIADDHAMMRDGIGLMVQAVWPDSVCVMAHDFQSVIESIDRHTEQQAFSAVVLDLRMPGMRGVESVALIAQRAMGSPVIVCTALEDPSLVQRLLTAGIHTTVSKTDGSASLLQAIRSVVELSEGSAQQPVLSGGAKRNVPDLDCGSAMLTARQREILKMLHTGKPSKVIAAQLGIGLGTIKSHLHTLYVVMGVSTRSEAIVKSQNWLL